MLRERLFLSNGPSKVGMLHSNQLQDIPGSQVFDSQLHLDLMMKIGDGSEKWTCCGNHLAGDFVNMRNCGEHLLRELNEAQSN